LKMSTQLTQNKKQRIFISGLLTLLLSVCLFNISAQPALAEDSAVYTNPAKSNPSSVATSAVSNDPCTTWCKIVSGAMSWTVGFIIQALAGILSMLVFILIFVAQYNHFVTAPPIVMGWAIVRDVSNMFFVLILLAISIGTIVRAPGYQIKSLLPKVILMAVLVNFSKTIAGLLIDFSQIVTLTFVSAIKDIGAGNILSILNLDKLWSFNAPQVGQGSTYVQGGLEILATGGVFTLGGIVTTYLFALVLMIVAVVVVLILTLFFVQRLVALWILVVFSPFAYVLSIVPQGSKYASQWWDYFSKYLIVGPVMAFLLWLAFASLASNADFRKTLAYKEGDKLPPSASTIPSAASASDNMIAYIISVAMLMASIYAAKEVGGMAGSAAGKSYDKLVSAGTTAVKAAKLPFTYAGERAVGWTKLPLMPSMWKDAFQKARHRRYEERTTLAASKAREVTEVGFLPSGAIAARNVGQFWTRQRGRKTFMELLEDKKRDIAATKAKKAMATGEAARVHKTKLLADARMRETDATAANATRATLAQQYWEVSERLNTDPDNEILKKQKNNIETENARLQQIEADFNSGLKVDQIEKLPVEVLNSMIHDDAEKEKASLGVKIKALEDGKLSDELTHRKLGDISGEINKITKIMERLKEEKRDVSAEQKRVDELKERHKRLSQYAEALKNGTDLGRLGSDVLREADVDDKYSLTKEAKADELASLHLQKSVADVRADRSIKAASLEEEEELDKNIASLDADVKGLTKSIGKTRLPTFYREQARRQLVGEELDKIKNIKNDEELITLFKQARHEGEKYKMMAILQKMASDGNDNEFLNGLGYRSDFEGYKKFFENEVADNPHHRTGISRQEALSLANDISYVNEERNHWDTARTVSVDPITGEKKWKSLEEHVAESFAEIKKINPQRLMREVNRLAMGGEDPNPDGSRTFEMGALGFAVLEMMQQQGLIEQYAKGKGQLQNNMATNVLAYLRTHNLPEFKPTKDNLEGYVGRLGSPGSQVEAAVNRYRQNA
jgi:hypothetical protein